MRALAILLFLLGETALADFVEECRGAFPTVVGKIVAEGNQTVAKENVGRRGGVMGFRDLTAAAKARYRFLNPLRLDGTLQFLWENAVTHGQVGGQARIAWEIVERDGEVVIRVFNEFDKPLPTALAGKVFRPASGEFPQVPDEQRDAERGRYGAGVQLAADSLAKIYVPEAKLTKGSEPTLRWIEAPTPSAGPPGRRLVGAEVRIPKPR